MSKKNVSLWIGTFNDEKNMKEYFRVGYTEDGDRLNSNFEGKFSLDNVEDDFREVAFWGDNKKSIDQLIMGCSYEEKVIPMFMESVENAKAVEGNMVALLYDFDYKGERKVDKGSDYDIYFIGSVEYTQE